MVSYCNSLAMYRHQQQGPAPGWYGPPAGYQPHQVSQQYLSCMQDATAAGDQAALASWHHPTHHAHAAHHHAVFQPGEWSSSPGSASEYMHHSHHLHQHALPQSEHAEPILPSPPMTVSGSDMSSPSGGGTASPPQTNPRPLPARSPFEWMKKPSYQSQPNPGKTRTKDKYRVVYSDHQRLELEKEFHYSRYITIRRKAELAASLGLSERQVKIWFQNRRAKERKQTKKREELDHKVKLEELQPALPHPQQHHHHHHHPLLGPQHLHHHHHHNQHSQLGGPLGGPLGGALGGSIPLHHHMVPPAVSSASSSSSSVSSSGAGTGSSGPPGSAGAPSAASGAGASSGTGSSSGGGMSSPSPLM